MKRLISPIVDGGAPYLNQDFFNILQDNNLKSYSSLFDEINDYKAAGNNGIIIKGILNTSTTNTQGDVDLYQFNFKDSMIFLNGEFLEPESYLVENDDYLVNQGKFWLIPKVITQKRFNKVKDEEFDMLVQTTYDITLEEPTDIDNYIIIEISQKNANLTTRYLSRILKWNNVDYGEVLMTIALPSDLGVNVANFSEQGVGLGPMFGFRLLNAESLLGPQLPTPSGVGIQGQISKDAGLNLEARFLIGHSRNSPEARNYFSFGNPLPEADLTNNVSSFNIENYGFLRNAGGTTEFLLTYQHIPPHGHGSYSGVPNNDLSHSHEIGVTSPLPTSTDWVQDSKASYLVRHSSKVDTQTKYDLKYQIVPTDVTGDLYKVQTPSSDNTKSIYQIRNKAVTKDIYGNAINQPIKWDHSPSTLLDTLGTKIYDIKRKIDDKLDNHFFTDHDHDVDPVGGDQKHENMPPYYVVAYYQKYYPYTI